MTDRAPSSPKRVAAIHQPHYLPWLPYIAKALQADVFVFLDDVQYQKNGVQNRNQVKGPQADAWLTVPVQASLSLTIATTPIADATWRAKHLRTLEQVYSKAPHRDDVLNGLAPVLAADHASLADLNVAVCRFLFGWLGLAVETVRSSSLPSDLQREARVIDLCVRVGADTYLSGPGAASYQSADHFDAHRIELRYQTFESFDYPQCHGARGFAPHLSAIDLFMNVGRAESLERLTAATLEAATA